MYIITIDTGTTNSRLLLWQDDQLLAEKKSAVGVRNTSIDGHNQALVQAVAGCYRELLDQFKLADSDIGLILASGMLTSNLGLYEVPHLAAPVSLQQFTDGLTQKVIAEISSQPIHFVPGVKNFAQPDDSELGEMDIMRGEEVEAIALAEHYGLDEAAILALPGSHSKFVALDDQRSIVGCVTTLTGELNSIITHNTILTNSLENRFADELDVEALKQGADEAVRVGMGKALFSIRIREQFAKWPQHSLASFLLGILLQSDFQAMTTAACLQYRAGMPIIVGGKGLLCEATVALLQYRLPDSRVMASSADPIDNLSARGAMFIARQAGLLS